MRTLRLTRAEAKLLWELVLAYLIKKGPDDADSLSKSILSIEDICALWLRITRVAAHKIEDDTFAKVPDLYVALYHAVYEFMADAVDREEHISDDGEVYEDYQRIFGILNAIEDLDPGGDE